MAMIKRQLYMEKFIYFVILLRPFLMELPGWLFYVCVVALLVVKNMKEGNTIGTIPMLVSLLVMVTGDLNESEWMMYLGVVINGLGYWVFTFNLYKLPQTKHKVGLKQSIQHSGYKHLYWTDWHPISEETPNKSYNIKWTHTRQIQSLCGFINIKPKTLSFHLVKYFTSFISKANIELHTGQKKQTDKVIVFSHGNSTTPFMHSVLLREMAEKYQIYAPQHVYNQPPTGTNEQVKEYREKEIVKRAADLEYLILKKIPKNKQIILMGHSHGGSTAVQAYHNPEVKKRVSEMILLDPWFFPLSEENMEKPIQHPTLLIANEYWQANKDIHERMQRFIYLHGKVVYFCLKKAGHDAQTDLGYILGDMSPRLKHPELTHELLNLNITLIKEFLTGCHEELPNQYSAWNLGRDYKPEKWLS